MPLRNPPAKLTTQHIPPHIPGTELLGLQLKETAFENKTSYRCRSVVTPKTAPARRHETPAGWQRLRIWGGGRQSPPWTSVSAQASVPVAFSLAVNSCLPQSSTSSLTHPSTTWWQEPKSPSCPVHGEGSRSIYRVTDCICLCTPPFPLHHV